MMEGLIDLTVFDDDENHDSHNEGEEEFSALFQSVVDDPTIATTTIVSFSSSSSTSSLMEPSGGIWMDEMEEEDIILSLSSSPSLTPIATGDAVDTTAAISALSIVTRPFISQGTLAIYLNPQNQVYCLEFFYEYL